ncbi:RPL18AC [Symbiodinium natans]|uniref:RPL18AC protein n=1 Tax=Symbiodinium natans TaxID=878477 RepID=A0A812UL85_9DINO|nr:RPL18AC [Symbiodinium natans]
MSEQDAIRCMPAIAGIDCALCKQLLRSPVATGDGYSYCRQCILDWYRAHDRQNRVLASPITNEPLTDRMLLPNLNLRDAIRALHDRAMPAWRDAEKERLALRREIRKMATKDTLDPRVADAKAEADQTRVQLQNTKQELQRLQIELERYHTVMEDRDASVRDVETQARLAGLAAELQSSKTEVTRLQQELEKTRAQARLQAEKLEVSSIELQRARLSEQSLQQDLSRMKDEYRGALALKPTPSKEVELTKAHQELTASQAHIADLQAKLIAARQAVSRPDSPTALELPPASLLQADLSQMKQALSRQDTTIAELQTQITAVRAERRHWQELGEWREQRRLEAEDEALRLRNELATIERRNLISSELERTAEVATQEAERLEMELLRVQGQRQQSDSQLAGLASALGVTEADPEAEALIVKVQELQGQMQGQEALLRDLAASLTASAAEMPSPSDAKGEATSAGADDVERVIKSIDILKAKVHEAAREIFVRDELLAEAAAGIADFLEALGLAAPQLPKGAVEATRAALEALDAAEDSAARLARAAASAKQTPSARTDDVSRMSSEQ